MKTLVRLNSEEKIAEQGQYLESLATVVSQALGGGNNDDDDSHDDVQVIESFDQLVAAMQGVGGSFGG